MTDPDNLTRPAQEQIDEDTAVRRAAALAGRGGRVLLGITGPPGAGKSTLAARIAAGLGPRAVVVGMDGFHLAGSELDRLGRRDRKGAPDTFDAPGYVALLRRLRRPVEEVVHAPEFRREIEEPIAGAVAVTRDVTLVVTDGNYLLLDGPWQLVRTLLDEVWYVELADEERRGRLLARHLAHGKPAALAHRFAFGSDEANAGVVAATRALARLVVVR